MSNRNVVVLLSGVVLAAILGYGIYLQGGPEGLSDFNISVVPTYVRESVPGQRCVLLVTVSDLEGGEGGPVEITATAPGASVEIEGGEILPGEVAEVSVIPDPVDRESNITVTITGKRGVERKAKATIPVVLGDNEEPEMAPQVRDRFISWLEVNHPELSITADTEWTGTLVTPRFLVVTHYLYFSEEWEMHVYWHVMIEPYNWAKVELRQRFRELSPFHAFEISSLTQGGDPVPMEPPDEVWR
jgi:hypothetical protein